MKNAETHQDRVEYATELVTDFDLETDAEFFTEPQNRLDFISSLDADEFADLARHINARMRGYEPREKTTIHEKGGFLPLEATPKAKEKPESLEAGFNAIKEYLDNSADSVEEKTRGVGMAVEALIIWVHPYNDGNGRTSRFLAKFIEDGTTDIDELITETASNDSRQRIYNGTLRVDQWNLVKDADLIMDDDELESYRVTEMPVAEGIAKSLKRLLENKAYQDKVDVQTERYLKQRAAYEAKHTLAA
ncbi:Fic family protein [Candidatus Saccharibacteria bacterium]|nr:Fic family protein [Candidatus Saccharibacteria bacterium]